MAILIEIKKENIDLPTGKKILERMRYPGLKEMILEEGRELLYETMNCAKEIFTLHKVTDGKKTVREYLVKLDEEEIFQDLIAISKRTLDQKINRALAGQRLKLEQENRENIISVYEQIRNLPWYKRLLKQF